MVAIEGNTRSKGPLDGVTVVDLTVALSGPFATQILCDLGANVLKVEPPPRGDTTRGFPPFLNRTSTFFAMVNRGKKSIMLDLKSEADRPIFEALLENADVLVENFRPHVLTGMGYSWDVLHKRHPKLILASLSGFGHSGPYKNLGALDLTVQGYSGFMSVTGYNGNPPTKAGTSVGDTMPGTFLFGAIASALYAREKHGRGMRIDLAMFDTMVAIMETHIAHYLTTGRNPEKRGSAHPNIAPFQSYRTKDGYVNIAGGRFSHICKTVGVPHLSKDIRFKRNKDRVKPEVTALLQIEMEKSLRTKTTSEWIEIMRKANVVCGPVNTVADMVADPQVRARNMLVPTDDPELDNLRLQGNPIKFDCYPDPPIRPRAPRLDEHREELLCELGMKSKL
eukprot:206024_1